MRSSKILKYQKKLKIKNLIFKSKIKEMYDKDALHKELDEANKRYLDLQKVNKNLLKLVFLKIIIYFILAI